MPNTPSVDPPIAVRDNARLLAHEAAVGAILSGLKKARPELFLFGSFNVDPKDKRDPIRIPNPTGVGPDVFLNYRIELSDLAFDIAPADITVDNFPDPFNLVPGTGAIFAAVTLDLAGDPTTAWQIRIVARLWLECKVSLGSDGWLDLSLLDASIQIDQVLNSTLLAALNHILHDYLATVVPKYRVPVTPLVDSDWFSVVPTAVQLQLDAIDLSARIILK